MAHWEDRGEQGSRQVGGHRVSSLWCFREQRRLWRQAEAVMVRTEMAAKVEGAEG